MNLLREIRKAVVGESWELPTLVAVLIVGALAMRELASETWDAIGGPLLLLGTVAILVVTVIRTR